MAGIIGNMTAQARLRRGRKEILSDKCVYELKPFAEFGFDADKHNKFIETRIRNKTEVKRKLEEDKIREEIDEKSQVPC